MSTFASLHYHVVFATKHRVKMIHRTWEERLHNYLGGTIKGLDGVSIKVGGVEDHVHALIGLKPTHRV